MDYPLLPMDVQLEPVDFLGLCIGVDGLSMDCSSVSSDINRVPMGVHGWIPMGFPECQWNVHGVH